MARDGIIYVVMSGLSGSIFSFIGIILESDILLACAAVCAVAALFFILFFRDPERKIQADIDGILSPGDGFVVALEDEDETEFFQERIKRISIFLTVFDVHINRIPCSGTVAFFKYIPGMFKAALKEEASHKNEQTAIGIVNGKRKVLFKQIAGVLARRIVCTVKEGQIVEQGERCGLIKFGSRVDVLVPANTEIFIHKKQKVQGGITILGRFAHD